MLPACGEQPVSAQPCFSRGTKPSPKGPSCNCRGFCRGSAPGAPTHPAHIPPVKSLALGPAGLLRCRSREDFGWDSFGRHRAGRLGGTARGWTQSNERCSSLTNPRCRSSVRGILPPQPCHPLGCEGVRGETEARSHPSTRSVVYQHSLGGTMWSLAPHPGAEPKAGVMLGWK